MGRIALLLPLVAGSARADAFEPAPGRAAWLGLVGHATRIGGEVDGGMGPGLELALGSGRWQYFGEATLARVDIDTTMATGWQGRGGLGVRWIARQFQPEPGGGVELFLEAVTGVERYWWHDGGQLTRPDLGAGFGMQVRAWSLHGLTLRLAMRVVFTPTDRDASLISCRGSGCPVGTSTSVAGLGGGLGVAW